MHRFWDFILRRSRLVVLLFAALSLFSVIGLFRLRIDYSIDSFYPEENPVIKASRQVRDAYGMGKMQIIVLYAEDVFAPERLRELLALTETVKGLDGVIKVRSLTNVPRMREEDGFLVSGDLIPSAAMSAGEVAGAKVYLESNYALKDGLMAARDGSSTTMIVQIDPDADGLKIAADLDRAVKAGWGGRFEATGVPVFGAELYSIITKIPLIALGALVAILCFLALNFRSRLGVVLPLVPLLIGLLWGVGFIAWTGKSFVALMAVAPIAILAVGSSFSLHLLGRYYLELSLGKGKEDAIRTMIARTGLGVFVSGLAISASMLTFLLSELDMIRGMGLMTAVGIFSCMVASLVLLPALLILLPAPRVRGRSFSGDGMSARLRVHGVWIGAHPKLTLALGLALVFLSALGIFRIEPDTSVVAYFPRDSAAIRGMRAVEGTFGGSTQLCMVVNGDLQDPDLLASMLSFQEEARSIPGVGPVQSLASTVRTLHETLTGEAGMPASRELVAQELLVYQASGSVDDITSFANLDYSQGLVSIAIKQVSSRETRAMIASLRELAERTIGARARIEYSGDAFVVSILEEIILKDFLISLTLAVLLVFLIDSLVRSMRAALVTIGVLVFTIILQYGVLGIFGMPFTMATALMGALAIGVGDYAIHFTVRYMEDRRRGLAPERSIEEAIATSGRSIVYTSLTLAGGFSALLLSSFTPVATLGKLMVFTVVAVGAASLTLLPAACLVFLRNPNSRMEVSND